jgi:hypothetical protein
MLAKRAMPQINRFGQLARFAIEAAIGVTDVIRATTEPCINI